MNFSLKPTLEHIALVHVTATLWNNHDIRFLLIELLNSPFFRDTQVFFSNPSQSREVFSSNPSQSREMKRKWETIKSRIKENASQLMIPTTLKEKISSFILPVGLQIIKWMEYHRYCYSLDLDLPDEFHWTPQGTIDKKNTASVLINDESINITTRYKLACIYCLEDDVQKLWNEIPESHQKNFYDDDLNKIEQKKLVVFWTYFAKGELARIDRIIEESYTGRCYYHFAFKWAAEEGNKEATKYFLEKLTTMNKPLVRRVIGAIKQYRAQISGSSIVSTEYHTEVLCFLLSQMNEKQQIEVFKREPVHVLKSLLNWPWQNFFLETAKRVCNFLPEINDYNALLCLIAGKVRNDYTDYNYQEMFGKLWQQYPDPIKSSLIHSRDFADLICLLLEIKDKENIKLIFQNVPVIERRRLILNDRIKMTCKCLIYKEEYDFLKTFIQLCISSTDEVIHFKQKFLEHISDSFKQNIFKFLERILGTETVRNNDQLDSFFKTMDDLIYRFGKRKNSSGDDSGPAKKLCKSLNMFP